MAATNKIEKCAKYIILEGSKHFCEVDMYMAGSRRQLRKNAKPSIFEHCFNYANNTQVSEEIISEILQQPPVSYEDLRLENVKLKYELELIRNKYEKLQTEFNNCKIHYEAVLSENEMVKNQIKLEKVKNEELRMTIKRRQSTSTQPVMSIERFFGDEGKLLYYTGVQSFNLYYTIFRFALPKEEEENLKIYSSSQDLRKCCSKISFDNQLFLTLIRLRRGFNFGTLGDLFGISLSTAQKIFNAWINLLYIQLSRLDFWPNRNIILDNAPEEYKTKYRNVIGSIDCTEFYIEQPSSLIRQSQCYSNYKGSTTLKSLIMTDPNGCVMYVSPLFTGSISDKQIVLQSGFLSVLKDKMESGDIDAGDIILADKGFNVSSLFNDINVELNIPTYRITGCQFSAQEIQQTRVIAHERVHVERAIGRLKSFKILKNKISINLFSSVEQVHIVCCLLTNFRHPLRKPKEVVSNKSV